MSLYSDYVLTDESSLYQLSSFFHLLNDLSFRPTQFLVIALMTLLL